MGISTAERRLVELGALVKCQLQLIKNLKERDKDSTSAKNVFDSLRVGFFLAAQDGVRNPVCISRLSSATWQSGPARKRWTSGKHPIQLRVRLRRRLDKKIHLWRTRLNFVPSLMTRKKISRIL